MGRGISSTSVRRDDAELELLKAAARQRLAAGQAELDLGLDVAADQAGSGGGPLAITSTRTGHLWDALGHAYQALGLPAATGGEEVFWAMALARIIEPISKLDSLRVLEEVGVDPPSYGRSSAVCRCSPRVPGGLGWPLRARRMPDSGR